MQQRRKMERGDDRKKRRVMEMVIVERVKQGLPLQKDALEYLIAYFDLNSLNNFCSTSWTMQQFCHNNQIWRKKFARHIPGPGHWLQTIKREQWLHYWDFLSTTRCPNQYRLLVAFLSVFRHYQTYSNPETTVTFYLSVNLENTDDSDPIFRNGPAGDGHVENEIGIIVPMIAHCSAEYINENDERSDFFHEEDAVDVFDVVDDLGWETKFYDYDHDHDEIEEMDIIIPQDVPHDAVTIVYKFISKGYLPQGFDFRTITARIGATACAHCATPKPKTVCGSCEVAAYCGQQCADAHWQEHGCK